MIRSVGLVSLRTAAGVRAGFATLGTLDWVLIGLAALVNLSALLALFVVPRWATNRVRKALRSNDPTVRTDALQRIASVSLKPYVKQVLDLREVETDPAVRLELATTLLRSDASWSTDKRLRAVGRSRDSPAGERCRERQGRAGKQRARARCFASVNQR